MALLLDMLYFSTDGCINKSLTYLLIGADSDTASDASDGQWPGSGRSSMA